LQEEQNITYHHNSIPYLCLFDQKNKDFYEERSTIYEQRIVYGKLHRTYKKALSKALQTSFNTGQKIIYLTPILHLSVPDMCSMNAKKHTLFIYILGIY
jgi:hypothetical protein